MPGEPPPMPREEPETPAEAYQAGLIMGEWVKQAEGTIAAFLQGVHDGVDRVVVRSRRKVALLAMAAVGLIAISFLAGVEVARR